MTNYKEMDQTHWVCYELPGKSYFYGEVSLLDENGALLPKDSPQAANPKNKLVKHGFGVYLYAINSQGQYSRYEGTWERDRKHGQGKLTVPRDFTYEGEFKDGSYHEQGKMVWANGDAQEGNWKKGRMEGGGIFKHHEGFVLKGSFKASHFIEEGLLRNPQMGEKEYAAFKKQRKEVLKQKQRNQKVKQGFATKLPTSGLATLAELCHKSYQSNRIPLVIASESSQFNLATLQQHLSSNGATHAFDLRKASHLSGQERYNYKMQLGEMTRSVLKDGGSLIINLDESQVESKQAFYPQIREFYDPSGFNSNTWSRQALRRKEVSEKVIGNAEVSQSYLITVWSKVMLEQQLKEQRIREKLQQRFQTILPFIKIDIVFVVSN